MNIFKTEVEGGSRNGQSMPFLGRLWKAVTDLDGRAVLEDLPPGESQWIALHHTFYQMPLSAAPWRGMQRSSWIDLRPGDTTVFETVMEAFEK